MMEHHRKLFTTFIWIVMVHVAHWISLLDKGMFKIEEYGENGERINTKQCKRIREGWRRSTYKVSERDARPPR